MWGNSYSRCDVKFEILKRLKIFLINNFFFSMTTKSQFSMLGWNYYFIIF